jgi:hypothetical protein
MVDEVMCMDGRHGMVRLVLSTARWTVNVECDGDLHVEYQIKDTPKAPRGDATWNDPEPK